MVRYSRDSERINTINELYAPLLKIDFRRIIKVTLKDDDETIHFVPSMRLFATSGYMMEKVVVEVCTKIIIDFLTPKQLECYVDYAKDTEAFDILDYDVGDLMIVADSLCCYRLEKMIVCQILDENDWETNLEWEKVVDDLDVPVYKGAMKKFFSSNESPIIRNPKTDEELKNSMAKCVARLREFEENLKRKHGVREWKNFCPAISVVVVNGNVMLHIITKAGTKSLIPLEGHKGYTPVECLEMRLKTMTN
uniref:Tudor domain-containing protein n=1 Tax=Rhabditophanes sp. KR3021 TaxID=114890 RepID=A0AC35UDM7_9BILA